MRNAVVCVCILLSQIGFGRSASQTGVGAREDASAKHQPPSIPRPLPFAAGEILTYDISFSKFILSGTVGQLKMSVVSEKTGPTSAPAGGPSVDHVGSATPDPAPAQKREPEQAGLSTVQKPDPPGNLVPQQASNPDRIKFVAESVSKGFVTWLFDLKVDDQYQSVVDPQDLGLIRSTKFVDEGNKHRQADTLVDRAAGSLTYSEKDLNNEKAVPAVKKVASPGWIQDLLSAIYFLRTQDLQPGTTLTVPVTDKGELHNIDVVVGKREQIDVEAGKFDAIQVEVMVFDGKYIKRAGQLLIWFTDDARRLPVRARVKSSGATATIKLTKIEHT